MEIRDDKPHHSPRTDHKQDEKSQVGVDLADPSATAKERSADAGNDSNLANSLTAKGQNMTKADDHLDKPGTSNVKMDSATEEELEYESEPASITSLENRRKRKLSLRESQGKTMYPPPSKTSARELRELTRKHFKLEKNLKIEGIPELPKIRKRRMSTGANLGREFKDAQYKRRRLLSLAVERPRKGHMPNWGSLGGDATDPLNLNGLAHSEEGRLLNLKTPENSPLPTPDFRKIVYVKVPPNIEDPLNLEGRHDQGYIDMLLKSTRKKRHRSKKNKDSNIVNQAKDDKSDTNINLTTEENIANDSNNTSNKEKEESPTLQSTPSLPSKPKIDQSTPQKQAGAILNRSRSRSSSTSPDRRVKRQLSGLKANKSFINEPKKFPDKPMFTFGNYNRYYGYRNSDQEPDPRLRYFNPQLFENKDVLDIGCNVGHITLAVAEHFHPRKILGMDIDGKLIKAARQNMRHMLTQRRKDSSKYPSVFEMTRGPLEAHPLTGSSNKFPNNILFLQGNYVPASEDIVQLQQEEYDTILALSITKWIHLNNGDHGLKLFFQKIARQLRPGGHLILEPQPWSTYRKRAKLTPDMFKHYSSVKLKPEGFKNYLLSIGFVKCEVIGVPVTKAKGFRRPLILFTKADWSSSSNNVSKDALFVCTECREGDTECDHIQFAGMRRGAYADRMYDHISYQRSMREAPLNNGTSSSTYRQSSPYYIPNFVRIPLVLPHSSSSPTHPGPCNSLRSGCSSAVNSGSQYGSGNHSSSGSGSQSSSQSSHSSLSGSTYTESSSSLINGDNEQLPVLENAEADMNGDIADEIVWVNNDVAGDGDAEVDLYVHPGNGDNPLNGDSPLNGDHLSPNDQQFYADGGRSEG